MITENIFWAIVGSTLVATIVGVILNWIKEYFQEKARWKNLTQEKLYGTLPFHLLMIRALGLNRDELLNEISAEPIINDAEAILKKFGDVNPINAKWRQHIQYIKDELEAKAGYIREDHFKVVENFLDSLIKREITQDGKSIRATPHRIQKIFDALERLDQEILQDNLVHYWFKAKLYGWGWTPARWQGWLVIAVWLVLVLLFAFTIDENSPTREVVFTGILPIFFLTVLLIRICYKTGEKPRWQWGTRKDAE